MDLAYREEHWFFAQTKNIFHKRNSQWQHENSKKSLNIYYKENVLLELFYFIKADIATLEEN